jgi:uncharacterized Zn finger protein
MTSMPFQPEDLEQAQKWILQGQVRSPLFSEGTYQIEVVDNGKSYWPFLQLSDAGEILDSFCTCPEMDKKSTCAHLAACTFPRLSLESALFDCKSKTWLSDP